MVTAQPNLIWITIDSIRHDHTSLGDYSRDTTPNLREIADSPQGNSFSDCFSHAIFTQPSAASILTGTYPTTHGLGFQNEVIPDSLPTVAERLQTAGYRTGAISDLVNVSKATKLNKGFDVFNGPGRFQSLGSKASFPVKYPRAVMKQAELYLKNREDLQLALQNSELFSKQKMGPMATNEIMIDMIEEFKDDQFFIYTHYNSPHHPYVPPPGFITEFTHEISMDAPSAQQTVCNHLSDWEYMWETNASGTDFSEDEWEAITAMYDAEIAFADYYIGDLFRRLRHRHLRDTVIIITADHGDLFGEQGVYTHKLLLHDGLLNVPLVTYNFDVLTKRQGEFIQHIDIIHTFLSAAGASTTDVAGKNLSRDDRSSVFFQRSDYSDTWEQFSGFTDDLSRTQSRFHTSQIDGIRTSEYKLLKSDDRVELFDMPNESDDVSDNYPERVAELEKELTQWRGTLADAVSVGDAADFSDEFEEQLKYLGYK